MKGLEKIFLKMSGREQSLLVVSLWVVFLLCFLQVIQISFQAYTDWKLNEETINGHRMILGLKPAIDSKKKNSKIKVTTKISLVIWHQNWPTVFSLKEVTRNLILMKERDTNSTG
jgi:hypothetical protein